MHKVLLSAALCILLLTPGTARALDAIVAIDNFPPWKIVEDGKFSGIDTQLVEALLAEIDLKPKFVAFPWTRSLEMMKTGNVWLMSGVLKHPERELFLNFVEPPYKTRSSKVFYRRADSEDILTHKDLRHLDIGVQRGAHYYPEFDDDTLLNKKPVPDDSFNFRKLSEGRLDAVITTETQGDYLLAVLGLQDKIVKSTYRYDSTAPVYFAVSKRSPLARRMKDINAAARRLHDNGTFRKIITEFFKNLKAKQ